MALVDCKHIQVDEPLFVRKVPEALDYGSDHLEHRFNGCPDGVTRVAHMCCGLPDVLDVADYPKAQKNCYFKLAEAIGALSIKALSVEDATGQTISAYLICSSK